MDRRTAPTAITPTPQPPPPPPRVDLFERERARIEGVLSAIDWSDPVASGKHIYALTGELFVAVINTPELSRAEITRLEWVSKLGKQLRDFRDVAEIEALRRKLTGADEKPLVDDEGPQLEPTIVVTDVTPEAAADRVRRTFAGRPRKRLLS